MKLLDEILVQMREEDPLPPSSPPPSPAKRRGAKTIRADGRPLTNSEKVARSKLKKKMLEAVISPGGGGKAGGVDNLAALVRTEAIKGVKSGALQVTVRDGLLAEKLIDSREGKIDDRRAMIAIAAALTGRGLPPPPEVLALEDGNTVEGDFEELRDD